MACPSTFPLNPILSSYPLSNNQSSAFLARSIYHHHFLPLINSFFRRCPFLNKCHGRVLLHPFDLHPHYHHHYSTPPPPPVLQILRIKISVAVEVLKILQRKINVNQHLFLPPSSPSLPCSVHVTFSSFCARCCFLHPVSISRLSISGSLYLVT